MTFPLNLRVLALLILTLGIVLTPSNIVRADLPAVRFDRMVPLGVSAGGTVEVEIQGTDLEGVEALVFDRPGLAAERVKDKERRFTITAAADVPDGTYDVYLVGRFGVSNPRRLAVSHGLTEVADEGKNHSPETAQRVAVNAAVNGTIDGNAEDVYRFTAKKGQRVTIDCQARRLDSELDGTLTLSTAAGQLLGSASDDYGSDPFLDFIAPEDGEYLVALHDLSYRGGHPYRLVITDHPQIECVFPAAVQAGQATQLTAYGRNLGNGSKPSPWKEGDLPLDALPFTITAPADVVAHGEYRFLSHPTHHSVAPTAATCTLTGMQVQPDGMAGTFNAQPVLVTDGPVTLEAEPNDVRDQPQPLALPAVVSGRFDQPRDADWYALEGAEDGAYSVEVYSERIAGRADPYVVVCDEQGNRLNELDDFGHRMNAFDGHLRDPSGMVNLNKGRKYRVLVQDRYQRGGARYRYVLEIRKPRPDFFAAVIHSSNPNPGGTTVGKGSAAYLDVVIHQHGGYNGEITLTAEDLPPGLHADPVTITNNSRGTFVLWADEGAADWTGPVRLVATGRRGDEVLRREVRPYSRVWNNSGTSVPQRALMVAIRDVGPFALTFEPERLSVTAGQKAELKLKLVRRWPDFKEKVTIQPLAFPGQFQLGNFDIPAGQTEAAVSIQIQPGTRPGDYSLVVLGQAQVPFNKDPAAASKPSTLVSRPSRPVTITVTAPPK